MGLDRLHWRIRAGVPRDAERLAVLATQVWVHTYATDGISSEIAQYVLSEFAVEKYAALLRDSTTNVFVAEAGHNLVGLAVVKVDTPCPARAGSAAELQTLYVQEHFVGQGIGKLLLREAEHKARSASNCPLWLTVNARNLHAITFYAHQGYSNVGIDYFVLDGVRHENHVLVGRDA